MKIVLFIFTLYYLISIIYCQVAKPTILQIEGTIYDQYPTFNDNFEPLAGSLTTGLVLQAINSTTRTPNLVSLLKYTTANVNGRMNSPDLFQYFYQSNQNAQKTTDSGLNVPIPMTINLTLDENKGTYIYDNQYFFPIDNRGFDVNSSYHQYTDGKSYHNFHFCLKINSKFTYQGFETFSFIGDDDVFVFINDVLVIDLGGLHQASSQTVDLTKLGLTVNKIYNFDFFYCERHTTQSTIRIETNMVAYCSFYDYCGVCFGDGSTCCNPVKLCNDNNLCTTDVCPPADTVIATGNITDYCQHIPVTCNFIDNCQNNTCSLKTGQCEITSVVCADKTDKCLSNDKCDAANGCLYSPICVNDCDTGVCGTGGVCVTKTNSTCATSLGNDICSVYYCDANAGGCKQKPLCPQGSDPCVQAVCTNGICSTNQLSASECDCGCDTILNKCQKNNCVNGVCKPLPLDSIDDGNACTQDICDITTGTITHKVSTNCTGCMKCDAKSGSCIPTESQCQDGNECTTNECVADTVDSNYGVCKNTSVTCPTDDKCKVYTCNYETGCVAKDVVCPNSTLSKCQIGYCDSIQGCLLKERVCNSTAFCLVSECDDAIGCVTYDKRCSPDNGKCQTGVCVNGTTPENGECKSVDYDPKPFICKTAAVVSTAVVAGVVVAGAVALAAAIFGGKKGYDHWKTTQGNTMASSNANPLYEASPNGGENPLYNNAAGQ